jgi:hypothetical protein
MPFEHGGRQNGAADTPQIRETSAFASHSANDQRDVRALLGIVANAVLALMGMLSLVGGALLLVCAATARRLLRGFLLSEMRFGGDFRDQVGRRLDMILACPGQLLRRRVATAMFPTLTRRCAAARMMLAGERHVRLFVDGRRQRDSKGGN